ncbi:hypothetical protein V8G54_010196 [Vigna mungo]|uniref:PB1-like domain-containing protein n=1 Tax=Vigna mungo TaxID=3915 RepID=A0AAQ3S2T7_VIGMU
MCVAHLTNLQQQNDILALNLKRENFNVIFDQDILSYFLVVSVVKRLGYVGFKELWYCVEGGSILDNRLKTFYDDIRVMHMANLARLSGQVHVFVVHIVSEPYVIQLLEYVLDDTCEGEVEFVLPDSGQCVGISDDECERQSEIQYERGVDDDGKSERQGEVGHYEENVGVLEDKGQGHGLVEVVDCEGDVTDTQEICDYDDHGDVSDYERTSIVKEEFYVRSWSSCGDDDNVDVNSERMEGLVDINSGNVEVDVQSLSDQYGGLSWTHMLDNDFDDNISCGSAVKTGHPA